MTKIPRIKQSTLTIQTVTDMTLTKLTNKPKDINKIGWACAKNNIIK